MNTEIIGYLGTRSKVGDVARLISMEQQLRASEQRAWVWERQITRQSNSLVIRSGGVDLEWWT